MFASEEGKKLMKDWNLPEGLMGVGALALGYASAHPHTVKPKRRITTALSNKGRMPGLRHIHYNKRSHEEKHS